MAPGGRGRFAARATDGVLSIDIERKDIGEVRGPRGVTFTPPFELDGTLTFQPLGDDLAFFNGDLPLKTEEASPFIDALIANGLTFQAFHQHYIEMSPNVWFIHWRGLGNPIKLAQAVHNVLRSTLTRCRKPRRPIPRAHSTPVVWTGSSMAKLRSAMTGWSR